LNPARLRSKYVRIVSQCIPSSSYHNVSRVIPQLYHQRKYISVSVASLRMALN